jgi:hypothetical protein
VVAELLSGKLGALVDSSSVGRIHVLKEAGSLCVINPYLLSALALGLRFCCQRSFVRS